MIKVYQLRKYLQLENNILIYMNEQIAISLGWNCNSAEKSVEIGIRKKKSDGYSI